MSPEPTLALLNATDNPRDFGGRLVHRDMLGSQLWHFPSVDKYANRDCDCDGVKWTGDIDAWDYYLREYALQ